MLMGLLQALLRRRGLQGSFWMLLIVDCVHIYLLNTIDANHFPYYPELLLVVSSFIESKNILRNGLFSHSSFVS